MHRKYWNQVDNNNVTVRYLIEVSILSGGEAKTTLLGLKCQEAGEETFGNLQVIAIEPAGSLSNIPELVSKLLLHDGVELCLITFQGIKLYKTTTTTTNRNTSFTSSEMLIGFHTQKILAWKSQGTQRISYNHYPWENLIWFTKNYISVSFPYFSIQ